MKRNLLIAVVTSVSVIGASAALAASYPHHKYPRLQDHRNAAVVGNDVAEGKIITDRESNVKFTAN
jgi:hypothetical protein